VAIYVHLNLAINKNLADEDVVLYYQITYALTEVPDDVAYFHAQWRRSNPLKCDDSPD
jgi:hypothetical protein